MSKSGGRLFVEAPTGTGKSLAFILPLLEKIDTQSNKLQAIIAAPTRELAKQLYMTVNEYTNYDSNLKVKLISNFNKK